MSLLNKPKVIFLIILLVATMFVLISNGLRYGLDFDGGTQFVLTLEDEVSDPDQMSRITNTITQRLDWSGLKDVKVSSWGDRFITAQVAVSDPKEVAKIEDVLQKQGRFENVFEGEILFTGDDIIDVQKDPNRGYGITSVGENGYRWTLPFVLNTAAATRFSEKAFHKCMPMPSGDYDCPRTYFFIDRPQNAIILIPGTLYKQEEFLPADPLFPQGGKQIKIDELLDNAKMKLFVTDHVDENLKTDLLSLNKEGYNTIVVPVGFNTDGIDTTKFKVIEVAKQEPYPWVWTATGLKSVIWLTESVTNQDAPTMESTNFQVFYNLLITGSGRTREEAMQKLDMIYILLEAGSLPVGVEDISKETVSPTLGEQFLSTILIMGLIAIFVVAILIYLRYREWKLILPIMFISCSEIFLTLGFASLIRWNLDLASLAGLIAAVGTGVNDQIIITDEVMKNKDEKQEHSLIARIKNAFFIVFAAAATILATMLPILFAGQGLSKFVGFALTTIIGVLIGVIITRPVYGEIAKYIIGNEASTKNSEKK